MTNDELKQIMEILSKNSNISLTEAEEYFMATLSVGLSLNNEMRKDIMLIYNQNKLLFFKKARSFSGYNHLLLKRGDLEQEIYAKKTLGILLCAEESELIKGKVLRLIKKYYKEVYNFVLNDNYSKLKKKLLSIEESDKGANLSKILIVLYFYTMRQINADLLDIEVLLNAFRTASYFYNADPFTTNIQIELKLQNRKNRLAKVKEIVQDELGFIKNSSDILYSENDRFKDIIHSLRNLLIIDKIEIDSIAPKMSQDDLDKIMLAFLKTTDESEFDKTQVIQSFTIGYVVKMLLNKYLRARELYFAHSEENLYSELEMLKEKIDTTILEKDNAQCLVQKLTNEVNNYELKLKGKLLKQSKVYEAQISELNRDIDGIKRHLNIEMKNRQELSQLREFFFELKNEYVPSDISSDLLQAIGNNKVLIMGGTSEWRKRLKERFPVILTMDGFNEKFNIKSFEELDFVLFYYGYMNHKTYYKAVNYLRENNIAFGYIGKTNIDLVEFEIQEELNKRLKNKA